MYSISPAREKCNSGANRACHALGTTGLDSFREEAHDVPSKRSGAVVVGPTPAATIAIVIVTIMR
jgi:hypothetical protein